MINAYDKKNIFTKFESKISVVGGSVFLDTQESNVLVIDIKYKGVAIILSKLPTGFAIVDNKGRMIIIKMSHSPMPSELFSFQGEVNILNAKVYTNNSSSLATIIKNNHEFRNIEDTWDSLNSNWQEYVGDNLYSDPDYPSEQLSRLKKTGKSLVLGNNLGSNVGEFTLDGYPYKEDVYYDTRGLFYTKKGKRLIARYNKKRYKQIVKKNFRRS